MSCRRACCSTRFHRRLSGPGASEPDASAWPSSVRRRLVGALCEISELIESSACHRRRQEHPLDEMHGLLRSADGGGAADPPAARAAAGTGASRSRARPLPAGGRDRRPERGHLEVLTRRSPSVRNPIPCTSGDAGETRASAARIGSPACCPPKRCSSAIPPAPGVARRRPNARSSATRTTIAWKRCVRVNPGCCVPSQPATRQATGNGADPGLRRYVGLDAGGAESVAKAVVLEACAPPRAAPSLSRLCVWRRRRGDRDGVGRGQRRHRSSHSIPGQGFRGGTDVCGPWNG